MEEPSEKYQTRAVEPMVRLWMDEYKRGDGTIVPARWHFYDAEALAVLLAEEVCFINSFWWEKDWPEKARNSIAVAVNCSDVFAWACADAEHLPHGEIENLYCMWEKDKDWGAAVWCMIRRNQMPQKPLERMIRKAGIWDLDALKLGDNTQDAEVQAFFASLRQRPAPSTLDNVSPAE